MALVSTIPLDKRTPRVTGIRVMLAPGDANFGVEVQSAPDNGSGFPNVGSAASIAELGPIPYTGTIYTDLLPLDGAKRFYRARHIGLEYLPGAWSNWSAGAVPIVLSDEADRFHIMPPMMVSAGGAQRATLDLDASTTFGPSGRDDVCLNGDIEQGFSYWVGTFTPAALGMNPDITGLAIETSTQYKGAKSLKWPSDNAHTLYIVQASTADDAHHQSDGLLFRVEPGQMFRCQLAFKSSNAGGIAPPRVGLAFFDQNKGFISAVTASPQAGGSAQPNATTTWQEFNGVVGVLGSAYYAAVVIVDSGLTTGNTLYVDNVHVWRQRMNVDVTDYGISGGGILRQKIGVTMAQDVASTTSRNRFFNPGFQDLLAYWRANPAIVPTGLPVANNDADTYKGTFSCKMAHTGGQVEYLYQSTDPRGEGTDDGNFQWIQWEVRPSQTIRIDYSCKVSGVNVVARVEIAEYGAAGGLLGTTEIGADRTNTTWTDFSDLFTVGATTFWVVIRFKSKGSASGTVWWDELYFLDQLTAADISATLGLQLVDTQTFTSTGAGTWTKPTPAVLVRVVCVGAGGGGGGGRGNAAGLVRQGGGGGGGGAMTERWYNAADLGSTEALSVGTGGSSGAGGASGSNGSNGGAGGDTWFGNASQASAKQWAYGGGGGSGGQNGVATSGGGGGGTMSAGSVGSTSDSSGGQPNGGAGVPGQGFGGAGNVVALAGNPAQHGGGSGGGAQSPGGGVGGAGGCSQMGGGGGGAGGGVNTSNAAANGGAGGDNDIGINGGGGTAGSGGGGSGGTGGAGNAFRSGQGGGGGAGLGGVGGAGGAPGGGGGGGGGGNNGSTGGAGGAGARGEVRVYTYA